MRWRPGGSGTGPDDTEPVALDDMLLLQFDGRLLQVRTEILSTVPDDYHDLVAALVRAAYGRGLCDAMRDPSDVATLFATYGYDRYGRRAP